MPEHILITGKSYLISLYHANKQKKTHAHTKG